jgi:hypothetical protein
VASWIAFDRIALFGSGTAGQRASRRVGAGEYDRPVDRKWARPWFAATAVLVLAGVVIQLFVTGGDATKFGATPVLRALNVFAFFTIQSNLIVGGTTLLLALNPARSSTVFRVFRLTGVVAITVTFLVFHVALAHLLELDTWAEVANQLLHTVVPVLAVAGWVMFGPRDLTSGRVARLTAIFPGGYMIFTLVRGPLASDFYPYPFADAKKLGYVGVIANAFWIALLFVGLAAAATFLDKRLPADIGDRETSQPPPPTATPT